MPKIRGIKGFLNGSVVKKKNLPARVRNPWVGKIPWNRKRQPTSVFLPGEFHGHRSLPDCSLWGCRVDVTEHAYRGMKQLSRMVVILFVSKKCLYTKIIILIDFCDLGITCLTKNERQLENILLPYPH